MKKKTPMPLTVLASHRAQLRIELNALNQAVRAARRVGLMVVFSMVADLGQPSQLKVTVSKQPKNLDLDLPS